MMRAIAVASCAAALASLGACYGESCDAKAVPLGTGGYREPTWTGNPRPDPVLPAELEVGASEVTIVYTGGDGRRYRATYAIAGRGKTLR